MEESLRARHLPAHFEPRMLHYHLVHRLRLVHPQVHVLSGA